MPSITPPPWDGVHRVGHDGWMIDQYRDRYKGNRAFILGTGPSLLRVLDSCLKALADEYTFGLNLIMKTPLPFTPSALVVMISEWHWVFDRGFPWLVDQLRGSGRTLPETVFYADTYPTPELGKLGWQWVECRDGYNIDTNPQAFKGVKGKDINPLGFGHSVMLTALQLACWMGFDPIYLLGCDGTAKGHAYVEDRVLDYRGDQIGYHESARVGYEVMREYGRTLVDLSEGGTLPVPKGDVREVLG